MPHRFFIPSEHNDHRPHIFRLAGISAMLVVLAFACGSVAFQSVLIGKNEYLASVASAVLVDLTNSDRSLSQLPALKIDPLLQKAAQEKANDMAFKGYFAHVSPEGVTPWHWFSDVGYDYEHAGENLAINFNDSALVEQAWMNSPTHKANIVNPTYTEIGIATANGTYQGHQTTFVVQMFGTPLKKDALGRKAQPLPVTKQTNSSLSAAAVASDVLGTSTDARYSSAIDRLMTDPRRMIQIIFIVLGLIVLASLILITCIEASRKHIAQMIAGLIVLAVIFILFYIYSSVFFANVIIG